VIAADHRTSNRN